MQKNYGLALTDEQILAEIYEIMYIHKIPAQMACQEVANMNERSLTQVLNLFNSHEEMKVC